MDLILVVGEPGAGKSVFVPPLAHRVATGERFFGKRVRKGPILYLAPRPARIRVRASTPFASAMVQPMISTSGHSR